MSQAPHQINDDFVRTEGQFADHPSMSLIAKAIIGTVQAMEERASFLQELRTSVPGIAPGEVHGCGAYVWQGEPLISITSGNELAYRVSDEADQLPVMTHTDYWLPNSRALAGWRVLIHHGPKDWMPTALRAHAVVQEEAGQSAVVASSAV